MYVLFWKHVQLKASILSPCRILWIVPIYSVDAVSQPWGIQMGIGTASWNFKFTLPFTSHFHACDFHLHFCSHLAHSPLTPCTLIPNTLHTHLAHSSLPPSPLCPHPLPFPSSLSLHPSPLISPPSSLSPLPSPFISLPHPSPLTLPSSLSHYPSPYVPLVHCTAHPSCCHLCGHYA